MWYHYTNASLLCMQKPKKVDIFFNHRSYSSLWWMLPIETYHPSAKGISPEKTMQSSKNPFSNWGSAHVLGLHAGGKGADSRGSESREKNNLVLAFQILFWRLEIKENLQEATKKMAWENIRGKSLKTTHGPLVQLQLTDNISSAKKEESKHIN